MDHTTDHRAALFRLEGTLSPRPTLTAAAWLALNARRVRARLLGLSSFALAGPLAAGGAAARAGELAWSALEGMSEDRLLVLGELYAEEHLVGALSEVGVELVERCRAAGHRLVLLSDNLDVIARPVARHLGIDVVIANVMELDAAGRATGKLRAPVLGPSLGGPVLAARLSEHDLELRTACAYGSHQSDSPLLGAVALPCAVTPEPALRRMARELDWPVVG
ncbi:MAG: haloacid dehalogenase-like hydrolase [Sandaracinaceae bacterium]|nr:haloacid dehalogenase-like hydrolase [Sandaracinaceae bacterium]